MERLAALVDDTIESEAHLDAVLAIEIADPDVRAQVKTLLMALLQQRDVPPTLDDLRYRGES